MGTCDNSAGDAAAMREALTYARDILAKWQIDTPLNAWGEIKEARRRADAALAKPPHEAKWTANGGYEFACCSKCGHVQYAGWDSRAEQSEKIGDFHELYKFCPNCGAQMKGNWDGSPRATCKAGGRR